MAFPTASSFIYEATVSMERYPTTLPVHRIRFVPLESKKKILRKIKIADLLYEFLAKKGLN
ncbi:hypothetical protein [Sandaracinomonas limnophila]|uniref:hypothetical protein n=1 Tax=Sandaracinomonas limnophila TaxID=1862386 RepID=UPI0013E3F17C|nr:hypothetical protein [Sandaracinomonas limnophila]